MTPNEIKLADRIALETFIKTMSHEARLCVAVWALECLTEEQVIEVLTDSVPDTGLRRIADHINTLSLECDPEPRSAEYGYSEPDEHQLVADLLAEAKARKGDNTFDPARRCFPHQGRLSE